MPLPDLICYRLTASVTELVDVSLQRSSATVEVRVRSPAAGNGSTWWLAVRPLLSEPLGKRPTKRIPMFPMKLRSDACSPIVLGLYVTCFGIGAFNHARDFFVYGWRPYSWGPPLLEAFWTLLIILDILVIAMLLSRFRRPGLLLAAAIMVADVTANTYALVVLNISAFGLAVPLQATFLGFVLGSLPFVWPRRVSAFDHQH